MSISRTVQWWLSFLSVWLLCCANPGAALSSPTSTTEGGVFNLRQQQYVDRTAVLQKLAQADVVYLGETHDRLADHQAQLEILQALHHLRPQIAIGMEMFQRPYQSVLDRYIAGRLTDDALQDQSQYKKRWGYAWEFYAPVLHFAKTNQLPVVALNTPTEATRKTSRLGLDSLTLAERRFIPPLSAIVLGPATYRQRIQQIYDGIHHGKSNNASFDRFFQAQVLWDETMAERIAQTLQQQPETLVIVLVGQGHLLYGDGIPQRVARRFNQMSWRSRPLSQASVLLNLDTPMQSDRHIADFSWHSRKFTD